MKLIHLRLRDLTHYSHASKLQDQLVAAFLAHKAEQRTDPSPTATILTAEFHPVYTCGRREINTVSDEQAAHLKAGGAAFHEALRGGQTTFHGPGQLVAYPIMDLKSLRISPRDYVFKLEQTLIQTCARYGICGLRTDNPGVWTSDDDKIAALGVHLRRNITSHGVGLNVTTDLRWFDRIVACGLEGKHTTSISRELSADHESVDVQKVTTDFVEDFSKVFGMKEIFRMNEDQFHHSLQRTEPRSSINCDEQVT